MISNELKSRMDRLLRMLKAKTLDGTVEWSKSGRGDQLETSTSNSSFIIMSADTDGIDPFILNMFDRNGILITVLNTKDETYPEELREAVRDLWVTINTSAAHVMRFLDQALDDLEDPDELLG